MQNSDKSSDNRFEDLQARYQAELPGYMEKIEEIWGLILDSHWDQTNLEALYQVVHQIAGTSASYGFNKIHTASNLLANTLLEILENPIGATSELQERAETHLQLLREAFLSERLPTAKGKVVRPAVGDAMRSARSTKKVYLVEDNPYQAEEIAEQLGYFGYSVTKFTMLENLFKVIQKQPPKAILMDVVFPEGITAGTQAVIRLKDEFNLPTPVVFISERDSFDSRLQGVRAGGEGYFTKPVDIDALVDVLDQLTAREEAENYRVLVVDDSVSQARTTIEKLQNFGMETQLLTDPTHIMHSLEQFEPNIILLDLDMPQCSGPELAKVIRQKDEFRITPIIYLSSDEDRENQIESLMSDADDFIPKSIQTGRFKNILQSHMDQFRILQSLMMRDSLTGLFNHTTIKERLDQEMARASRQKSLLTFAMIDLDHFKQVNDTHGHLTGDRVLKSLARLLTQRLRRTDIIGRYGGEEFAVILPDTPAQAAFTLMDELRRNFSRIHHRGGGADFSMSFSCGLASYPAYANPSALLEAADKALYQAKEGGRNRTIMKGPSSPGVPPV
jgi:diguanylate cyclase (GGDEF)-like protein